jgi:hypothetical protein
MVKRLKEAIKPRAAFRMHQVRGYEGAVDDNGFSIRRIAQGAKDSKPAVVIRGTFRAENDQTEADVVLRHGWHFIFFVWMLLALAGVGFVMAVCGLATRSPNKDDAVSWAGFAIMAAMGIFWLTVLNWDIRRIKAEVVALLKD